MQINSALFGDPLFPWLIAALLLALLGWGLYLSRKPPEKSQPDEGGELFWALQELHEAVLFGTYGNITEQEFCAWLQQLPQRPRESVSRMEQAATEHILSVISLTAGDRGWSPKTIAQFRIESNRVNAASIAAFLAKRR